MANVRDSDTSLWLHNKLGTSNDTWIGGSICSQLNVAVLRNIRECFVDLQTQVKLKLLLVFLHTPRRNLEEWHTEIEEILEIAALDSDQWVSMLAELLSTFPASGNLNTEVIKVEENKKIFGDLIAELKSLVKKSLDLELLPLECHYLNKAALVGAVGQLIQPEKHFALRRKPKSAALKVELLQKSQETGAQMKKNVLPTVPTRSRGMPRKLDNATPLKGIPSRLPSGAFTNVSRLSGGGTLGRTPAGRKEGRVKMLDIDEQPVGMVQINKKRRKPPGEEEERDASKKQKSGAATTVASDPTDLPTAAPDRKPTVSGAASVTPDYAAGLVSLNPPTPAASLLVAPPTPLLQSEPTATPTAGDQQLPAAAAVTPPYAPPHTPIHRGGMVQTAELGSIAGVPAIGQPLRPQQTSGYRQSNTVVPTQNHQQNVVPQPVYQQLQPVSLQQSPSEYPSAIQQPSAPQQPAIHERLAAPSYPQQQHLQQQQQVQQQPQQQVAIIAQPQNTRRGLALTREQMLDAQEMFSTANKVTRPEKALILGFIAGSRENPCPHLGNVVTIKLSEDHETVMQEDGSCVPMLAETHFQMNYSTGEWKRIKKYCRIADPVT